MIIFHTNGLTVNGDCSVVDAEGNLWGHVTKFGDKWLWDNGSDTKWYDSKELLRIKDLLDLLNYYLPDFSSVYPVGSKHSG